MPMNRQDMTRKINFFSGKDEAHGIKNIGDKPVTFHVLTAPKFDSIEEHFIEI